MTIGNLYLEYQSLAQNIQDDHVLNKAQNYFEESIAVIEQLRQMNKYVQDDDIEAKFRDRALLLCRGRSYTNLGKTYFEYSEMIRDRKNGISGNRKEYMSRLNFAAQYLKRAERDAKTLKAQAVVYDADKGAHLHRLDANLLISLTCRFQGYVFLRMSRERECVDALKKACGIADCIESVMKPAQDEDKELIEAKVGILLEQYEGASSLIQISSLLFDLAVRDFTVKDWNAQLLDTLCKTFDKSIQLSEILSNAVDYSNTIKENLILHGIRKVDDIKKFKGQTLKRLNDRASKKNTLSIKNLSSMNLPRNDLSLNSRMLPQNMPSERIVIDSTHRRKGLVTANTSHRNNPFDSVDLEATEGNEIGAIFDDVICNGP
jgi:transcription antitermination factor NusG